MNYCYKRIKIYKFLPPSSIHSFIQLFSVCFIRKNNFLRLLLLLPLKLDIAFSILSIEMLNMSVNRLTHSADSFNFIYFRDNVHLYVSSKRSDLRNINISTPVKHKLNLHNNLKCLNLCLNDGNANEYYHVIRE